MKKYLTALIASILVLQSLALAQGQPPVPSLGETLNRMLPMFIMVFFIFYFLILRPQQKRIKVLDQILKESKAGDQLVTSGGIVGKFVKSEGEFVILEIANSVKIKVEAAHIQKKMEKDSAAAAGK